MKLALENPSGPIFELDEGTLAEGLQASRESLRLRVLLPIHRHQDDLVQRMVNFMQPGSYLQPHLHSRDSASESIILFRGVLGFLHFDEEGKVVSIHRMTPGSLVDIVPCLWHSVVVLAPDTVIGEFKRGPYNEEDKTFADWAPSEGTPEAKEYLAFMESQFETDSVAGESIL